MSKELKALERIKKVQEVADYMENETDIIENALKDYGHLCQIWNCKDSDTMIIQTTKTIHDENNKKLKVLEIIKNYFEFNGFNELVPIKNIPLEEFNLVQEVLKNDD